MKNEQSLAMIAAIGPQQALGRKGDLIWHISADLKNFKRITTGHPVIMGRKTWESLPKRPLPGRLNIILSRSGYSAEGAETAKDAESALSLCNGDETPMVIGGAEIYRLFLPIADTLYITRISAEVPDDTDTWFPEFSNQFQISEAGEWETAPDGIRYRFEKWMRQKS